MKKSDGVDKVVAQWNSEKPHLDTLPMALLGRMMRLSKHVEAEIAMYHKSVGLTMGEFDVLATLRRSGGDFCLTPSALLASMMLTSGAMTNRLDRLTSKGLISRQHSTEDRRSVSVALTKVGVELIDLAIDKHVSVQQGLLTSLSDEEQKMMNGLFKQWLQQFEA